MTLEVTCLEIPLDETSPFLLEFSIKDTGVGIPKKRLHSIFDSFTQADSTTTRRFGGTGLGLTISKRLCEMMGGQIHVESKEQVGTTFTFTLPVPEVVNPAFLNMNTTFQCSMPGHKILIASTNVTRQKYMSLLCHSWGMRATLVDTASAISDCITAGDVYDALIIDHHADKLNTNDVLSAYKTHTITWPTFVLLPVTETTNNIPPPIRGIIQKPLQRQQLYDELLECVTGLPPVSQDVSRLFNPKMSDTYPLSILIAEDDKINQDLAMLLFSRLGYTPHIVL